MYLIMRKYCLIVAMLSLTACGQGMVSSEIIAKDPNTGSNNIYRSYKVSYSEEKNQTHALATFHLKNTWGDYIELSGASRVQFNGQSLSSKIVRDEQDGGEIVAFYAGLLNPIFWLYMGDNSSANYSSFRDGLLSYAEFDFTDQFGQTVKDTVNVSSVSILAPDRIRRNESFQIEVIDSGVYDSYKVQVKLISATQRTSTASTRSYSTKKIRIDFSPEELLNVTSIELSLVASYSKRLEEKGGEGGTITVNYMKSPITILVR